MVKNRLASGLLTEFVTADLGGEIKLLISVMVNEQDKRDEGNETGTDNRV